MKIIVEIAKTDLVQLIASLHDKMQIDINATELEPKLTTELMQRPLSRFELSVRAINCMHANNIFLLEDLVALRSPKELLKMRNLGRHTYKELCEFVEKIGLHFGYKQK